MHPANGTSYPSHIVNTTSPCRSTNERDDPNMIQPSGQHVQQHSPPRHPQIENLRVDGSRPSLVTAFSLWSAQKRQQSPLIRPRRLKRMWTTLSNAEKNHWRSKLRDIQPPPTTTDQTSEPAAAAPTTIVPPAPPALRSDQIVVSQCTPANAAAHLLLLGDSLHRMGSELLQHDGNQCSVAGALSVLLDAFLCALGPLMALAREIPGVEESPLLDAAIGSTLDNIAYIVPGL